MRAAVITSAFLVLAFFGPVTAINWGWMKYCHDTAVDNCKAGMQKGANTEQSRVWNENYFGCLCKAWYLNYPDKDCHKGCMKDHKNKAFCDKACSMGADPNNSKIPCKKMTTC
ncbi:hypothetical protein A4X06_0g4312 [Tilletia controversa]|uniref:Uncharacterized protein n=1 Tax=Tilletia controversa TaxID=13291 RepID=A0A8X7MTS1_9BASI|nr:hypothetical protein A4X06_0g4312 [Tilletia controversa]